MSVRAIHGDMLSVIQQLVAEGVVVDSVVTDPPYHLGPQKTQEIGWPSWTKNAKESRRQAKVGFMGSTWDGGDIAFRTETWATVSTILRPGAFMVAFGGTRTHHRLACAIEDAGFVIQDCLMWLFAAGFPKRRDNLKPAYEPIILAYKPGGARTMQIDECRIAGEPTHGSGASMSGMFDMKNRRIGVPNIINNSGRWPANILHDGSDEIVGMFPHTKSGQPLNRLHVDPGRNVASGAGKGGVYFHSGFGDEGSAARFFFSAKAGAEDRWGSRHPTIKPIELMKWLVKLVTPQNGVVLDCFAGSGTTGVAALATGRNAILIEREESYCNDIQVRLAFYDGSGLHSNQAKARSRKVELGPLFQDAAE